MPKVILMLLVSLLSVGLISSKLGFAEEHRVLGQVTILFLLAISLYHYYFIWFPKALRKGQALQLAVKIIYTSVDEAVLDQDCKGKVLEKINVSLNKLSEVLDRNLDQLSKLTLLTLMRKRNLEEAWRSFFLEALVQIEKEIEDQTVRRWTYNKIMHKLNDDERARQAKMILQPFLKDSQFFFIVEPNQIQD